MYVVDLEFVEIKSGDARHRWNPPTGQGVMRFILALLLMSGTAMAQVQNRTYQDSMGRNNASDRPCLAPPSC